ncbi:MAG: helix-hairpin-helix domain-containing protein [Nitrososphaerales archaeon]|nr:helix-hairpin-helix domain-containing protein [Nitrososphaerales archaeon]
MMPGRVVADERERASGVPDELSKLNVRVYFSQLPVADYVLNPEIAVERKSVRDLVSSVYDSRLFYQAAKLAASYAKPYLLIEGDSKEVEKVAKNLKSYYGAISNITLAYGLRMLFTANPRETAIAIAELLGHARAKPLAALPADRPPRAKSIPLQQVYTVSSLPGVGRKLAEKLLLKYGTPRNVMGLTAGEMSMTQGLGWKRAEKIKEVLDAKYTRFEDKHKQMKLEE